MAAAAKWWRSGVGSWFFPLPRTFLRPPIRYPPPSSVFLHVETEAPPPPPPPPPFRPAPKEEEERQEKGSPCQARFLRSLLPPFLPSSFLLSSPRSSVGPFPPLKKGVCLRTPKRPVVSQVLPKVRKKRFSPREKVRREIVFVRLKLSALTPFPAAPRRRRRRSIFFLEMKGEVPNTPFYHHGMKFFVRADVA